ncbi:hypothetical protein BH23GEM7_BH23GEM7_20970 [soil metagenome]
MYREQVARSVRETVLRSVLSVQRTSVERHAQLVDPARLRAERDSLAVFLIGHSTLEAENRQLRDLLGLRPRLPRAFVAAEVIRVRERGLGGTFLLTAGEADGVRSGAPVVTSAGLVGMVRDVDERVSIGIDWTHQDFRASAMTVDGEVYGIVEPRLSAGGEALLALTGVPFHTELDDGALIVTSGRGGVYPRGIPIGAVSGMEESDAGWRKSYLLRPLVGPAEMTHVLILGEAEQGAADQDLAASWGVLPPEPRVDTLAPGTTPPAGGAAGAAPAAPAATPAQPRREPRLLGVPVQPSPAPPDTGRNGQGRR